MEQNKSEEDNQSTEGTDQSGTGSVATSGSGTSYHFTEDSELLWPGRRTGYYELQYG